MGRLMTAAEYDSAWEAWEWKDVPARKTPWFPLWQAVLAHIRPGDRVLDLGCGAGHLALLRDDRDAGKGQWTGVDFSSKAIEFAKRNTAHCHMLVYQQGVKPLRFVVGSVTGGLDALLAEADVVVLSEVLEHVADDLAVLRQIPIGKRVVLSVPNFDSENHVRRFETMRDAEDRYREFLDPSYVARRVDSETLGRCWWVIAGTRNGKDGR